jgi:hypothetical protein
MNPPAGLPPLFNENDQEVGTTGGLIPGGLRLPDMPPTGVPPGMPTLTNGVSPAAAGAVPPIPRGMPPATGYGLPPTGMPPMPGPYQVGAENSGPVFDGPSSVPGASNFDARMRPPPASLTQLLTNPGSYAPGAMRVPGNTGAAPGDMPPGWDPASRTLSQTSTPPPMGPPPTVGSMRGAPAGLMPPSIDPAAFAAEAVRRARAEGEDTDKAFRDASRIMPAGAAPMPGSRGFGSKSIPGVGSLVLDNATGLPVDGAKVIKQDDGKTKLTEAEVAFETNVEQALAGVTDLRNVVKEYGTWESAWAGNPQAAAKLAQLPYQLAIQYAKIVDPSSVAREGEVAAAQKYLLQLGAFKNKDTTLAALDNMETTINGYKTSREKVRGGSGGKPVGSAGAAGSITAEQARAEINRRKTVNGTSTTK